MKFLLQIIILFSFPCCILGNSGDPKEDAKKASSPRAGNKRPPGTYITDKITANDDKNIKAKAESVVVRFMNLLNTIATGLDLEVPETEGIIRKSYQSVESKIFYDSAVVVVDDLRKVESVSQAKEKTAYTYLRDFEIFYKKSENASVFFSNFQVSNVKKGNYLYIKVTYDCLFGNKSKISEEPYSVQKRVAELRIDKHNNKWKTWIIDVHFLDSVDVADAHKNEVQVVESPKTTGDSVISDNEQDNFIITADISSLDPRERDALRRKNDSVRTYMAFRNLVDSGKHSLNKGRYIIAYQFFNEAETVVNGSDIIRQADVDFLQTMIKETRKNIAVSHRTPDELFNGYMQDAIVFKNQRQYDKALEAYTKAISIKPSDETALQKRKVLSNFVGSLVAVEARYTAGKYKDAIVEYDKLIKSDPQNSDYYVGRGKCLEKVREPKKAMSDYNRAIELDENNLHARKEKGNLHEKQGDLVNAIACYAICAAKDKTDVTSYLKIADLNVLAGNQTAALAALDKGIAGNSSTAALYYRKGEILQAGKQSKKSIESLSISIMLDSTLPQSYFKRGLAYVDEKQVSLAALDFEKARKLGLDSMSNNISRQIASEFFHSATRQFATGYHEAAIKLLDGAILIDPYVLKYRFQRGQYQLNIRDNDNAIRNFSDVIAADPLNVYAFQLRGLAKYQKRQYREALADFEQAIRLNSKMPEAFKYAGDALLKDGDYLSAIVKYDGAIASSKSRKHSLKDSLRAEVYNGKGEASYLLGKYAAAMKNFNQAITIEKSIAQLHFNRGKTYLKLNKLKDAEENVRRALKDDPANSLWIIKLGEIYYDQGKPDKALFQYDLALPKDPKLPAMPEALYQRALCHVKMNNFSDAYKDLRRIQASGNQNEFPDFNNDMGHIFLAFNQPDSAFRYFQKDNGNASDAMSMYGMAIVHLQKNEVDQAFQWLERSFATRKLFKSIPAKDNRIRLMREDKRYKKLMKKYF